MKKLKMWDARTPEFIRHYGRLAGFVVEDATELLPSADKHTYPDLKCY